MNISLSEQHQKFIEHQVESGPYESPDDVIDAALCLMQQRDEKIGALRKQIQKGHDSGDAESLDIEDIKVEGRKRLPGDPSDSY